jgi:hypothetical protein
MNSSCRVTDSLDLVCKMQTLKTLERNLELRRRGSQGGRLKEKRGNLGYQYRCETKKTTPAAPSTGRSVQFVATLYIHALWLATLVISSRSLFSRAIRTVLLALSL